jgi:hypothetical protein
MLVGYDFVRRVAGSVVKLLRERHFAILVLPVLEIIRQQQQKVQGGLFMAKK